jgi:hypothetical protein
MLTRFIFSAREELASHSSKGATAIRNGIRQKHKRPEKVIS